jgi:peptide/nickel transport system substrate-binding protein
MMKRRLLLVLALALVAALLAAPTLAQDKKIVKVSYTQEPDTLSPLYTTMWFSTNIIDLVLAPPWFVDDQGNPVPVQAKEIPTLDNGGLNKEGTVLTIKLRDDLKWSDGTALTADDYVFTYQMVMSDKNTVSSRFPWDTKVDKVEAPDKTTVVVTFKEPFAPWLTTLFTASPAMPKHILEPVFQAEGSLDKAAWNREPKVSSGPFAFKEWEAGSHLTVARNDSYGIGTAKVDEIFFRIVPDDAAQNAALTAGDADIGAFLSHADAVELEKTGNIVIAQTPSGYNEAWFLNVNPKTAHPAMLDVKVRQALALAFNREKIVKDLLFGKTTVAVSYWEGSPFVRPDAKAYPYDPEQAAKLLDEAGWKAGADGVREKDGVKLELRYLSTPRQIRKDVQAVVQQDFAKLGITVKLENPSADVFFNSFGQGGPVSTGQYDIAEWSQNFDFPDPNTASFLCSEVPSDQTPEGSNWTNYCDKDLDALFNEQIKTVDRTKRLDLFKQIDQKLTDAYVWIGVWFDADLWATNKRIQNVKYSGADPFWNAVNWDIGG